MAAPPTSPIAPSERITSIDTLRGLALFGVLQINLVTEFRVSLFTQFRTRHTHPALLDCLVDDMLAIAINSKAFALFSFLFGVGLGIQSERAARGGRPFLKFAWRRLAVLLVIGLVHLFLIWNGDILASYALVGLVVAPLARFGQRTLLALAVVALAVYVAPLPFPEMFVAGESMSDHIARAQVVYGAGTFLDIARFRVHEVRHIAPLLLASLPRTFSLYLLGIVAWRARLFDGSSGRLGALRSIAATGILVGGASQIIMFGAATEAWTVTEGTGAILDGVGQVLLACGYGAGALLLCRRRWWRHALAPFAPLGRAALSNYLAQSVLFGCLFYGYGGGLFGRLSPATAAGLGCFVYAAQTGLSIAWFRYFRFGPVEWVWRSLTYGAPQPMRSATTPQGLASP